MPVPVLSASAVVLCRWPLPFQHLTRTETFRRRVAQYMDIIDFSIVFFVVVGLSFFLYLVRLEEIGGRHGEDRDGRVVDGGLSGSFPFLLLP